jgi:hypothetical protein
MSAAQHRRAFLRTQPVSGAKAKLFHTFTRLIPADSSGLSKPAHTGSGAAAKLDRWSDIDLALALAPNAGSEEVLASWTEMMYDQNGAVAHHDVRYGSTLFRVFLFRNTLQVDLAFWPSTDFRAIGPNFELIFGCVNDPQPVPNPDTKELIGMGWLYALHVRTSIARARLWEAEFMLRGMRDQVLALACLRRLHPLPARLYPGRRVVFS